MNTPTLFAVPNALTLFCWTCREEKPTDAFGDYWQRQRYRRCKACHARKLRERLAANPMLKKATRERTKLWKRSNRSKVNETHRKWVARQGPERTWARNRNGNLARYGVTLEIVRVMLAEQRAKCAVCGTGITDKSAQVEHDHQTGRVRALTCGSCNRTIGHSKEDPSRLVACAEYIVRHRGKR